MKPVTAGVTAMMYNMMQISKLYQQEMLRTAEQRRLAKLARKASRSQTQTSAADPSSELNPIGRGLMALGLLTVSEDEPQIA